jgi:hypothetical protein
MESRCPYPTAQTRLTSGSLSVNQDLGGVTKSTAPPRVAPAVGHCHLHSCGAQRAYIFRKQRHSCRPAAYRTGDGMRAAAALLCERMPEPPLSFA